MKRKAKGVASRGSEKRQSISTTTKIDPDGDLLMNLPMNGDFSAAGLLVSRHTLCLSSAVFRAMLGPNSKFKESDSTTTTFEDGIQVITLEDDDFQTMEIIMNAIHLQSHLVPRKVTFQQLDDIAILCDKYDLR